MAIKTSGNTRRGRTRRPRRHAERALSEKEMRLRALVGSDDEIVFEFDRDATYLHVWTTNENLLTQPRDELIGRRAAEIMGEEWASPFVELFRRVLNTGKSETIEYPLELSTGPSFFLARVSPIPSSDGTPKSVCMLVRDITRHKQTEEMLAHRAQEMQALYETSLEINAQRDVPALLRSIVQRAAGLLGVKTGALYLMQPDGACLELVVGHNLPDGFAGTRLRVGEGMAGRVAQTREPLIVNNYRTWPGRSPQDEGTPLTGIIQVPMLYGGELIGVLAVEEVGTSPHLFSEQDARLLSLFAGQAAGAVHNARLVTETRRRAERLALLNRIARALNSTLKLDDLLEIVYREITSVMDAEAFFVALYDPTTTELDFRIRVDAGIREPVQRRLLTPGLTSFVVMHKQPLLIRDYECEKDQLPAAKVWGTMGAPQSWLGVPMLMGEKLVGVISVQAYRPNAYAGADQELLSTIADTVAVAIENARLFEETTRRAEQLTTLRELDGRPDVRA